MHPILFRFGPVTVYSYGVMVAAAFLTTGLLIVKDSSKYGIPKDKIWDLLLWILISGVVGARLLHVLLNIGYYKEGPIEIFMLHKGGLAIQGGLAASIFIGILYILRKNLPLWKTGDLIMQYLPLGQAIGRIGCLLNGCCYGSDGHPTQLYSALMSLCVFIILKYLSGRKDSFDGRLFLSYFILDSPARFFIDFLRGDLPKVLFGLTASQLIGAGLFLTALAVYRIRSNEEDRFKGRRERR